MDYVSVSVAEISLVVNGKDNSSRVIDGSREACFISDRVDMLRTIVSYRN